MTADAPREASQGRSRLGDIPYDEWDFEALAEISPGMKPPDMSVVAFFAHHPELARKFLTWNHYMNTKACELPRQVREMVILRVSLRRRSRYEWAQHIKSARRAGISDEEIRAIGEETYTSLAAELDERQLISLVFLVGTYSMLSMAFGTFQIELDPGLDPEGFDTYLTTEAPSQKGT